MLRTIQKLAALLRRRPAPTISYGQAVTSTVSTKPLVGAHQRTALKHAQLAAEIGWTGPRGAPQSWRGKR